MRTISSSFADIFPIFLFVSLENLGEEENEGEEINSPVYFSGKLNISLNRHIYRHIDTDMNS